MWSRLVDMLLLSEDGQLNFINPPNVVHYDINCKAFTFLEIMPQADEIFLLTVNAVVIFRNMYRIFGRQTADIKNHTSVNLFAKLQLI